MRGSVIGCLVASCTSLAPSASANFCVNPSDWKPDAKWSDFGPGQQSYGDDRTCQQFGDVESFGDGIFSTFTNGSSWSLVGTSSDLLNPMDPTSCGFEIEKAGLDDETLTVAQLLPLYQGCCGAISGLSGVVKCSPAATLRPNLCIDKNNYAPWNSIGSDAEEVHCSDYDFDSSFLADFGLASWGELDVDVSKCGNRHNTTGATLFELLDGSHRGAWRWLTSYCCGLYDRDTTKVRCSDYTPPGGDANAAGLTHPSGVLASMLALGVYAAMQ
jgi:hypothetical protein